MYIVPLLLGYHGEGDNDNLTNHLSGLKFKHVDILWQPDPSPDTILAL